MFRIAWWTFAGKELTSWLSACVVFLYAVLIVCDLLPHFPHLCCLSPPCLLHLETGIVVKIPVNSHCQSLAVMNFSVSSDCLVKIRLLFVTAHCKQWNVLLLHLSNHRALSAMVKFIDLVTSSNEQWPPEKRCWLSVVTSGSEIHHCEQWAVTTTHCYIHRSETGNRTMQKYLGCPTRSITCDGIVRFSNDREE